MQRDVYAAMIKKRTKTFIPIDILQMSGEITREQIFDEVFDGHRLRRLILTTNMKNVDPKLPRLPRDIVVPTFSVLSRIHQPHFQYKLLPLLCTSVGAFAALQGICSSPGSPFLIEHRREPLTVKFCPTGPANRDKVIEFFYDTFTEEEKKLPNSSKKLPINVVEFDGILLSKSTHSSSGGGGEVAMGGTTAGLLYLVDTLNTKSLVDFHNMQRFFWSPAYREYCGSVPLMNDLLTSKQRFHFLATKQPIQGGLRQSVLEQAKAKNIFIYEQRGDEFLFADS